MAQHHTSDETKAGAKAAQNINDQGIYMSNKILFAIGE
jgi:hypothetical protein